MQVAVKIAITVLVCFFAASFLNFLWRRDIDVAQYANPMWWGGKIIESWLPEYPNLVKNGKFERGLESWGSGWIEDLPGARDFARQHKYVNLMGAASQWSHDAQWGRKGSGALRVEHSSSYKPHMFSTFSQRIEVKPFTTYEAKFWVRATSIDPRGGLSLRIGPSDENEWDRHKENVDSAPHDWKEYRRRFTSDDRVFVDIRFVAEGPVRAWIDDVSVREVR